jgi:hypothetical protein
MLKSPEAVVFARFITRGSAPTFLTKTYVLAPLALTPNTCAGNTTLDGCTEISGAWPVPLKATIGGGSTALSVMVIVPETLPLATGLNLSVTGQTDPAATAPQFALGTTVGLDKTIDDRFSGALPQFVTFSVCVVEAPTTALPKLILAVGRHADGAGVAISILAMNVCRYVVPVSATGGNSGSKLLAVVGKSRENVVPATIRLSLLSIAIPEKPDPP